MQVEVMNLLDKTRTHPIRSLRKASDKEMLALHYKLGGALAERMRTFFPVIVHSTGPERLCIDIVWVDHQGLIKDKFLLQAIVNGQEIDTSYNTVGADSGSREDQVDI